MKSHHVRRSSSMTSRSRAVRPVLEGLEGRILMYAATGNHFTQGGHLTWSIEPDGTNLGSANSNLVSTLNARFGAGNWLRPIQDAFAVWENVANINTVQNPGQVSDNGAAINSGSYQQGNPSFGDIRIGGFGYDLSALGFAVAPPPANGGSSSGDIILNTNQPWQIGSDYDLETVMIHEIGHALGLGHSADSTASMYSYYHGIQQYVNSDDIAGVESIWSPRQEDGFVIGLQNLDAAHAVNASQYMGPTNQVILAPLDVAKSSESYWFKVTTPANASNVFQAEVQSTNLSELSPKVTIYDSNVHGLVQVAAPANAYGTIVLASINNATPNTTYYVKVSGSNAGPTGTGAYGLLINMGTQTLANFVPATTQVLAQADQGGGGSYNAIGGSNSSGLPGIPASGATSSTVGPDGNSWKGSWSGDDSGNGGGNGGGNGNGGKQGLLKNLGAWENIHNFGRGPQTGGKGGTIDGPEYLTIGNHTYIGDLLLTTPAPSTFAPPVATQDSSTGVFIPLDPTAGPATPSTPSVKKDSAVILINVAHPTGPF